MSAVDIGEIRAAIDDVLSTDSVLLRLLATNKDWVSGDTESKANSIVPMIALNADNVNQKNYPLITIQMGIDNRSGTHLYTTFFYIRCYNSRDKSYVAIDEILSRVILLLDETYLSLSTNVQIELRHQSTGNETFDQGYNLPYRESLFQLQRI